MSEPVEQKQGRYNFTDPKGRFPVGLTSFSPISVSSVP